jgi:dolichol-phosphate mannosyltransferase
VKRRIYLVVPVLDEAGNIERLMRSVDRITREFSDHAVSLLLVDDGSTDGTGELARAHAGHLDFTLLRHETNRGPGKAFATAFAHLAGRLHADDWVVTLEGDNTSRLEILKQMMRRTGEGYHVVLASPYMYGGGISNTSPMRVFLSHVANAFVKEALGIHGILTMSSFYRLYRGEVILRLQRCYGPEILERSGFESMIELLLKLVFLEVSISEVAMPLDTSLRAGVSKMKIARTVRGYLTIWADKGRWRAGAAQGDKVATQRSEAPGSP